MTVAHISLSEIRRGGHGKEEVSARDRRRLPQIVRHCQLLAYGPGHSSALFSLDLVYPSSTELSSGFRIDVEQLNIYLSRCSSSLPFTNLVSFPMHRSRNTVLFLHLFPGIDGRCSTLTIQYLSFKTLHVLFLPPLTLGKIASDVKESPAALGGGRDEKGRESHTPTRLAWMLFDIPESSTLVLTQSWRCSYYNVIHAGMGVLLLAFDAGPNGVEHEIWMVPLSTRLAFEVRFETLMILPACYANSYPARFISDFDLSHTSPSDLWGRIRVNGCRWHKQHRGA